MRINIILFTIFAILSVVNADESIDNLLNDIKYKTDLSQKTKIANTGISFIYTRDDIQRMQARYLKDILKSSYISKYAENRYGIADPLTQGTETVPFKTSVARIYIDNQEITTGLFGSGLVIYGDIDIGFADHIEIYTRNPTYEYSTESTMLLIKIYSKSTIKDEGAKVELNVGSYGASRISGYISQDLNYDWSNFTYISHNNDNRQKHYSNNETLSRDKDVTHLFSSFSSDNQRILLDITDQRRDAFMSASLDATPQDATIDLKTIHLGYDANYNNFSFLASYDLTNSRSSLIDDVNPIETSPHNGLYPIASQETKTKAEVFTTEIKYNYLSSNNKLTGGLKYRYKKYKRKLFNINEIPCPQSKNNVQAVYTLFMEDQIYIQENQILSLGMQFSHIHNNHTEQDDKLYMYRLGYTYLYDKWTSKTLIAHTESALEPYLIGSTYITPGTKKPQEYHYITQDIIFEEKNNQIELLLGYMRLRNSIIGPYMGAQLLDNYAKDIYLSTALLRWTYKYNRYDKLFASFDYKDTKNLYDFGHIKDYTIVIRNLNTYKNFDFFNELLYTRNNIYKKNFYDLSLGVKYNYNRDLTLSIKGENVFNKARRTTFTRVDPLTLQQISPISISPIDRKITLSIEYLF